MIALDTVVAHCRRAGWPATADPAADLVRSEARGRHRAFPVTILREPADGDLLFVVAGYLTPPADTAAETLDELRRLLLAANYELALGCFEMAADGEVRCRLGLPCVDREPGPATLARCLAALTYACDHYWPACQRVLWRGEPAAAALAAVADDAD